MPTGSYPVGTDSDTGIKCEFDQYSSFEIGNFRQGEWHSKQRVRPNNEQKWRSKLTKEAVISNTKIGKYPATVHLTSQLTKSKMVGLQKIPSLNTTSADLCENLPQSLKTRAHDWTPTIKATKINTKAVDEAMLPDLHWNVRCSTTVHRLRTNFPVATTGWRSLVARDHLMEGTSLSLVDFVM